MTAMAGTCHHNTQLYLVVAVERAAAPVSRGNDGAHRPGTLRAVDGKPNERLAEFPEHRTLLELHSDASVPEANGVDGHNPRFDGARRQSGVCRGVGDNWCRSRAGTSTSTSTSGASISASPSASPSASISIDPGGRNRRCSGTSSWCGVHVVAPVSKPERVPARRIHTHTHTHTHARTPPCHHPVNQTGHHGKPRRTLCSCKTVPRRSS